MIQKLVLFVQMTALLEIFLIFSNFANGGNTFITIFCLDPIKIHTIGQDIPIFVPPIPVDEIVPCSYCLWTDLADPPATESEDIN
ncbi:MAG: hypothetical protein CM1200mP10_27140 [Candidatus Neomarinimicrobiota bacterium]|nr:MAG: hypothetical protein CM1200mP10_27140 [Candidatus Neomarinimicrobiota bacterium]